jgi:hypothetical protein
MWLVAIRGLLGCLTLACFLPASSVARAQEVKVTVVAILATTKEPAKVHPKLEHVAREVQKREPSLKSFNLERTSIMKIAVGQKQSFPLVNHEVAEVTVKEAQQGGRVRLVVKAPRVAEITFSIKCDKFFPIVTGYQTANQERLIVAVMGCR